MIYISGIGFTVYAAYRCIFFLNRCAKSRFTEISKPFNDFWQTMWYQIWLKTTMLTTFWQTMWSPIWSKTTILMTFWHPMWYPISSKSYTMAMFFGYARIFCIQDTVVIKTVGPVTICPSPEHCSSAVNLINSPCISDPTPTPKQFILALLATFWHVRWSPIWLKTTLLATFWQVGWSPIW